MKILDKKIRNKVIEAIKTVELLKNIYEQMREDITFNNKNDGINIKTNTPSDPTASTALKIISNTEMNFLKARVDNFNCVISQNYVYFQLYKKQFIENKRMQQTAYELNLSEPTLRKYREEFFYMVAVAWRLIKIY